MALFPNPKDAVLYNGNVGKTHTNLVVSEGAAPAEQFIVSKTNQAEPFIYEFGPEGNQTVLIAKGKIVEAVGEEMNREVGHTETAIRVAGKGSIRAIGVNHHNIYDQRRDAMEGNRGTVITRSYIEVPLFEHETIATAKDSAAAMHFGAAYGETGAEKLTSGDFVMSGENGNFVKYDGSDFRKVVGQVLNVNRELPPAGLLNYYTGLKNSELETYLKSISATPATADGGYPYGAPYTVGAWKKDFLKALGEGTRTGIPFLTDGYFKAQELLSTKLNEKDKIEAVVSGDGATVDAVAGTITVEDTVTEASVYIKMKHKIDPRKLDQVKVTYVVDVDTTVEVPTRDVHVDVQNNTIVLFLDGGVTAKDVTVEVASIVNPIAGIPTEWDYKGSVGAVRILLQR